MSRFHFDESAVETVMSSFCGIMQNIRDCVNALNNISMELNDYEGFNIGYAIESINDEKNVKFRVCINTLETGYNVLKCVQERVSFYSQLAYLDKIRVIDSYIKSNPNYKNIFDEYNHEISTWTVANSNLRTGISLGFSHWLDLIDDTVTGVFKYGDLKGVERKNAKEALDDIIKKICRSNFDNENFKYWNDEIDEFINAIKLGKNVLPELPEDMPNWVGNFFKTLGNIKDIKNLSIDIIKDIFLDYSAGMMYIDTIDYVLESNGDIIMTEMAAELRNEYESKVYSVLNDLADFSIGKAYSFAKGKLIKEVFGWEVNALIAGFDFATDKATELSGDKNISENYQTLSGLTVVNCSTTTAYKNISDKIASGSYTAEDIQAYKNLFEMNRTVKINQYEAMIAIEKELDNNLEKINHYKEQINKLEQLKCEV